MFAPTTSGSSGGEALGLRQRGSLRCSGFPYAHSQVPVVRRKGSRRRGQTLCRVDARGLSIRSNDLWLSSHCTACGTGMPASVQRTVRGGSPEGTPRVHDCNLVFSPLHRSSSKFQVWVGNLFGVARNPARTAALLFRSFRMASEVASPVFIGRSFIAQSRLAQSVLEKIAAYHAPDAPARAPRRLLQTVPISVTCSLSALSTSHLSQTPFVRASVWWRVSARLRRARQTRRRCARGSLSLLGRHCYRSSLLGQTHRPRGGLLVSSSVAARPRAATT